MVSHWDVAVGGTGGAICEFSACSIAVAVAFAVVTEYSDHAFVSHVALLTTPETYWSVSVAG